MSNPRDLFAQLRKITEQRESDDPLSIDDMGEASLRVYPRSIHAWENSLAAICRDRERFLLVVSTDPWEKAKFEGEPIVNSGSGAIARCPLSHENADRLRRLFPFCRPQCLGLDRSFGFGDRLGLANPAHLRSVRSTSFRPVLAQQSIRELDRTERTAEEVLDTASWAVFQEDYEDGFGADGDHLKTTDDIDRVMKAGFNLMTFDPGEHVENRAGEMSIPELTQQAAQLPWSRLESLQKDIIARYAGRSFSISESLELCPEADEVLRALVKYGRVVAHVASLSRYLQEHFTDRPTEIELSVDETDSVTTPFEHYFIVAELKRLGVELVSLAPRHFGSFEKGIDYRGDLQTFELEYAKHAAIAEFLGPYKLSLHSGSDKFSIYPVIGRLSGRHLHVKTAGTSYLEAVKTVAMIDLDLFREILAYSLEGYEKARSSYHVSADPRRVPPPERWTRDNAVAWISENESLRQVLHVAFGGVLTEKDARGAYRFRDQILTLLRENEPLHFSYLQKHFARHLDPFAA